MKSIKVLILSCFALLAFNAQAEIVSAPEGIEIQMAPASVEAMNTDYHSYHFGRVWVNSLMYVRYYVTNTGTIPFYFSRATILGPYFDAYHSCGRGLQPGERCTFEIRYHPAWEGMHSGRFTISFTENLNIVVNVYGEAYR